MSFGKFGEGDDFHNYLVSHGQQLSLGNARFVARNFLLDEGVCPERRDSYSRAGVMVKHTDYSDWTKRHTDYLDRYVCLRASDSPSNQIDKDDVEHCPETFRYPKALKVYGEADEDLQLIRVVESASIARRVDSSIGMNSLGDLAHSIVEKTCSDEQIKQFNSYLAAWGSFLDHRPVWAALWADLANALGPDTSKWTGDWPDILRDQLGLYHLNPSSRIEIPIFVFRYRVGDLPRIKGERNKRPLAIPTVLDGYFSQAFCPAPYGEPSGFVVNLGQQDGFLRREVLHPFLQFRSEHLFMVGTIKKAPPPNLNESRAWHLLLLREEKKHQNYAELTDGDLL